MTDHKMSRRHFLRLPLAAAIGGSPVLSMMMRAGTVQAADAPGDYKALVCIFLAGGNDSFNMVVPRSSAAHSAYALARQQLAVPRDRLLAIAPTTYDDGVAYGLHPSMPEAQQLFSQKRLAVIANTGMLVEPLTKAEYEQDAGRVPPQLFSHSDQQRSWMRANAVGSQGLGWAGALADRIYPDAAQAPLPSPNITVAGANPWQVGLRGSAYDIPAWGVQELEFEWHEGGYKTDQAYRDLFALGLKHGNRLVQQDAALQQRSMDYSKLIKEALDTAPEFATPFPGKKREERGALGKQLRMVAKLIAVRDRLGAGTGRQLFFVRFGGWDTHDNQVDKHAQRLLHLSKSLDAFYAALAELGVENQVTAFTASEFGRSLTPNNNGTDHGWGGHSLVMGGAVRGGDIYGIMPRIERNSPDAVEDGRIIPTTSVEQYAATLARWFGLDEAGIDAVFPNLGNFSRRDLGFMAG